MSLLLDALNRASKDKAAAAMQAATPGRLDETTSASPDMKLEPVPAPISPASALPTLELSLSDVEPASASPTAAPADAWHTEMEVAAPSPSQLGLNPAKSSDRGAPPVASEPAPVASSVSTPGSVPRRAAAPSESLHAPRVAQEIVRAKAVVPRAALPRRVLVLGAVAGCLALGLGSVMLGWWGDPTVWFQGAGVRGSVIPQLSQTSAKPVGEGVVASASAPAGSAPSGASVDTQGTGQPSASVAPSTASSSPASLASRSAVVGQDAPRLASAGSVAHDWSLDREPCEPESTAPNCRTAPASKPSGAGKAVQSAQPLFESRSTGPSALEQGYAALTQGRLGEAAQAYGRALASNSQERDALLGLAYIAQRQGREEEARSHYQQVLRHEPGNPVARAGLLMLGAADDPQVSISRAREVAQQHPDSAAAQAALGALLVRVGHLADAQLAFQRAHGLEPKVAQHAFNLAVALDRLRNYGAARQYYERALVLSTNAGAAPSDAVPLATLKERLEQLRAAQASPPPLEPKP